MADPRAKRLSGKPGRPVPRDEVARRERFVEDALAAMQTVEQVKRDFRAEFKTGQRCAEKYVRRVHDRWTAEGKATVDREAKRVEIERAADLAFRRALEGPKPDLRAAAAILQLKAKLHGLASDRLEHSGPNGGPIPHKHDVDAAALSARIAALAAGRPGGAPGAGAPAGAPGDESGGAPGAGRPGGAAGA